MAFGAVDGRMQGGIELVEVPDVAEDHLLILPEGVVHE